MSGNARSGTRGVYLLLHILIVQRNGRTVRVEVPDRSTVRVADDGTVTVVPPEAERRAEEPAPSATDPRDVAGKLVERNPGFPGVVETVLAGDDVVEVRFDSDRVKDLSPLRSLTKLERLTCRGNGPEPSELTDLSPLSGLRLKFLDCSNTSVANLEPLRGMPLETLNCAKTNVADLRPLAESPLAELHVQGTRVSDLAPLRGMALRGLNASFTSIVDLAPLRDKPLAWLYLDGVPVKDLTPLEGSPLKMLNVRSLDLSRPETIRVLRSLKNLESVNSESPDEFWKKLPASATP